jgi:hypothetical protein
VEILDNSLKHILVRWKAFGLSVLTLFLLTFLILTLTLPAGFVPVGVFLSGLGILFGSWSIVKGDWMWGRIALLIEGLMLSSLILAQTISGTVLQTLPSLLLGYVLALYGAEALQLLCRYHPLYSKEMLALPAANVAPVLERTTINLLQRISRLGFLFAICYLLTLGAIMLSSIINYSLPVPSDISLYIVAVSTSLALLLVLRED